MKKLKIDKNMCLAVIADQKERERLFWSLDEKYAMFTPAFNVTPDGHIYANPHWWRKRNLWYGLAVVEIYCFCQGWLAGRRASN
jgi:hypothetical protein